MRHTNLWHSPTVTERHEVLNELIGAFHEIEAGNIDFMRMRTQWRDVKGNLAGHITAEIKRAYWRFDAALPTHNLTEAEQLAVQVIKANTKQILGEI